jgi:hypothetical protein
MIRLGLRLAVSGGRASMLRGAFTVIGVAVGVALMLLIIATQAALHGRAERTGWKDATIDTAAAAPDGAWLLTVSDYYRGARIIRGYVAALGPNPPVPPGLERLPAPGEIAVSPAMARLLAAAPDDELDDRYPGRVGLTIGEAGLAHADENVVIVGLTPAELSEVRAAVVVRGFGALPDEYLFLAFVRLFLLLGAVLLLAPIVIFIVMATRIAAVQREQRLAAIRLVGATRAQTAAVAVVETGVAVLAGTVLGWAVYEVGRRALFSVVTFQGGHFYLEDAVVSPLALVAVAIGVLAVTVTATVTSQWWAQLSPLGLLRRSRRSAPGARQVWRAIPLMVGVVGLVATLPTLTALTRLMAGTSGELVKAFVLVTLLPAFLIVTLVGLVLAGPWLCALIGAGMNRITRKASGMIAARRIAADPRAAFRTVSGVAVAAFTLTFFATLTDDVGGPPATVRAEPARPGVVTVYTGEVPGDRVAPLLGPGVVVERVRTDLSGGLDSMVPCADLARVRNVTCPHDPDTGYVEPTGPVDQLPVSFVHIPTDGSVAAQERTRTRAAVAVPNAIINTEGDPSTFEESLGAELFRIFQLFCLAVLLVAALSLTAGMVGAVIERRRPFALLRASGVPLSQLRRVVMLETAVPMVLTSVVGVGLGMLAAYGVVISQAWQWRWPDPASLAIIGGGILAAMFAAVPVLPLLNATTRHEAVRYE